MQLIQLLKTMLVKAGIRVKQSAGDADVMICQVAIDLADEGKTVEVAGKDTDLLVLLIHHYKSSMKLFFRTSLIDEEKCKETDSWRNIGQVASNIQLKEFILFAHIWGDAILHLRSINMVSEDLNFLSAQKWMTLSET